MRVMGGLVAASPFHRAAPSELTAMAAGVVGADSCSAVAAGPTGFFHSRDTGYHVTDDLWIVADLDLANLDDFQPARSADSAVRRCAALYVSDGPAFVSRLRGAFAIALWDHRRRLLLLAVDHFSIRRLYYASDARQTAFASRPTAVLGAPGMARRVDPTSVFDYLNFGYVPAPASIFLGVRRLAPGHRLLVQSGRGTEERYWRLAYAGRTTSQDEGRVMLCRETEAAVGRALKGWTPKQVGTFLSGGTDSSTVLGLAARLTGERISAFSIGFSEEPYDELQYAALAARHFDAAHETATVRAEEALDLVPRLVEAYDEPFGNNSAIGTLACAELARASGVSALLAGDGGDEIFGGNERYRTDRLFARYHRIPRLVRRGVLEPFLNALPAEAPGVLGRGQRYVRRANMPNPRRFYSYEFFFTQETSLLEPAFVRAVDTEAPYAIVQRHYDAADATEDLDRLLYLDLQLTIGDNDLLKVTRTAELAGVAVRFPLLDLALVEAVAGLPARFKVRGLEKRYLFKRAFRELLPPAILAKRKHGFGVPTSVWLKQERRFAELGRDTLLSTRALQRGYFRPGAVEKLFAAHAADTTPFYGDILWRVLMLELWHQRHLDQRPA